MMNRCGVLSNAYHTVEREDRENVELKRAALEVLREMHREAEDHFRRYR